MNQDVTDYYNDNYQKEWDRLTLPLGAIEFASTLRLIEHYFPKIGHVADIGSGPGRYSLKLCNLGYAVTLVDPAEKQLAFAKEQFVLATLQAQDFIVADARNLGVLESQAFDAALFLGPLIHITERPERAKALAELFRVLKPGGVAVVSYLNSWGLVRTGVSDFPDRYRNLSFLEAMLDEVAFHQPLTGFTVCHWSTPVAARQELEEAGFEVVSYASAEGAVGGTGPLIDKLAESDPVAYANVKEFVSETCELPQFRDGGDHLVFVVSRAR